MPDFALTEKQKQANKILGGSQRHTCLVGGGRSGKTLLLVRAVLMRAARHGGRHAIFRFRSNAARSSLSLGTIPDVCRLCFPRLRVHEHRQDGYFSLKSQNGDTAQIWVGGLDDKERVEKILGMEFSTIYFNECSQIPYNSVLIAKTRLAQNLPGLTQRAYYDLNPGGFGHWSYRLFIEHKDPVSLQPLADPENYKHAFINPSDNAANLTPEMLAEYERMPERMRRRFYLGEYINEVEGALWSFERLDQIRIDAHDVPDYARIVVAVDPSGASGEEGERSDEIGIIVAAKGTDGRGYVLEDLSCRLGPAGWARRAVEAYRRWNADTIVVEENYGGAMVRETIRNVDPLVPIRAVRASRGKVQRAEPVAALYEERIDRVRHVGRFPDLEDQMCMFSVAGYTGERSPDRADALIWAMHDLMLGVGEPNIVEPFITGYRRAVPGGSSESLVVAPHLYAAPRQRWKA